MKPARATKRSSLAAKKISAKKPSKTQALPSLDCHLLFSNLVVPHSSNNETKPGKLIPITVHHSGDFGHTHVRGA
jgi:hypothetical protein